MLAIIPIFIKESEPVWRSETGQKLLDRFIETISKARGIDNILTFSNEESIVHDLTKRDIKSYRISDNNHDEDTNFFPKGTNAAVRYIKEKLEIHIRELIILNFKNPLLTKETIEDALQQFKATKTAQLISIKDPEDHPCQLTAYYQAIDIGVIHFFENEPVDGSPWNRHQGVFDDSSREFKNSRPFYFDWPHRGINTKHETGLFARKNDTFSVSYNPLLKNDLDRLTDPPPYLWEFLSRNQARVLFSKSVLDSLFHSLELDSEKYQIAGASEPVNDTPLLFLTHKDGSCCVAFARKRNLKGCVFTYIPFNLDGKAQSHWLDIPIDRIACPLPVQAEVNDSCGLTYAVIKSTKNDTANLAMPFKPDNAMWSFDKSKEQRVNASTGKAIMGRQDFPEVWVPDGTFCVCRDGDSISIREQISEGKVNGYPLNESQQIQIDSSIDLLRYEAILKNRN